MKRICLANGICLQCSGFIGVVILDHRQYTWTTIFRTTTTISSVIYECMGWWEWECIPECNLNLTNHRLSQTNKLWTTDPTRHPVKTQQAVTGAFSAVDNSFCSWESFELNWMRMLDKLHACTKLLLTVDVIFLAVICR
jgi:hypothetical protein